MQTRTNYKTTKRKHKHKNEEEKNMRKLLRFLSLIRTHTAHRTVCASECACACAHFCKYFSSLFRSFSPPLIKFFSAAQKPFLHYSIEIYNRIEIKRWITIIVLQSSYLVGLELRFMRASYKKEISIQKKRLCFSYHRFFLSQRQKRSI